MIRCGPKVEEKDRESNDTKATALNSIIVIN